MYKVVKISYVKNIVAKISSVKKGFSLSEMIAIEKMVKVLKIFLWFVSYEFSKLVVLISVKKQSMVKIWLGCVIHFALLYVWITLK